MMSKQNDKFDQDFDQEEGFYILGGETLGVCSGQKKPHSRWLWLAIIAAVLLAAIAIAVIVATKHDDTIAADRVPESVAAGDCWLNNIDAALPSCATVSDTVVDGLHLQVITPFNATPELHVGRLDTAEADIVFATLAADIRRDNGKIVGAFVLAGEPLSWGLSKRGYCAISERGISIGVSENSPLFEKAVEDCESFFRHYPAVDEGCAVENNPKNLSYRRALCELNGKVCIVVSGDRVLMNDFSSALVKLGVQNAIFLVGGNADGWYRSADGTFTRLGDDYIKNNQYINYIVFRVQ